MIKTALLALALAASATVAVAAETKTVTRTVTVYGLADFPDFAAKVKAVCEGKHNLSDKAATACKSGAFPSVTKAGAFRNAGVGAELNTLIRQ